MKIPETYEEFLKTPKADLLKIDIPLEAAIRMMTFICKVDKEIRKKPITESKFKKKK